MALAFLKSIKKHALTRKECEDLQTSSCWLENLLAACKDDTTLDEFVLLNAVISQGRQLLRLVADGEHEEEQRKIDSLLETTIIFEEVHHWNFMNECIKLEHQVAIKWIGLRSWIMNYMLSKDFKTPESCEMLFATSKIKFCKADNYSLIPSDGSDSDAVGLSRSGRGGRRKKKRDRKRRRKRYEDESSADELVGIETEDSLEDFHSRRNWLLSTDGFSCSWSSADLPEHLSMHCFKTWMKWFYSKCL